MADRRPPLNFEHRKGQPGARTEAEHYADHQYLHEAATDAYRVRNATGNAAVDTEMLLEALDLTLAESLAMGYRGGRVVLGRGRYHVNQNITPLGFLDAIIEGQPGRTELAWVGASDGIPLDVVNSHSCTFRNFNIITLNPAAAGLRVMRDTGQGGINSSAHKFEGVRIDCQNNTPKGIVIGDGGDFSPNNDFHEFHRIVVDRYTDSGVEATGTQAYGLQFHGCKLSGGVGAQWGLHAAGASVSWRGGSINGNGAADILLKGWEQVSVFDGLISEGSKRLLHLPNNFRTDVIFRGLRWANNAIHADGRVLTCEAGVLANIYFEGCKIAAGAPVAASLDFTGAQADSALLMRLCDVYSTDAAPVKGVTPVYEAVKRYFSVRPGDRVVLG